MSQDFHTEPVADPAEEPVSLAEAKKHLRVPDELTDDDELIAGQIAAARQRCEVEVKRAFVTQTWDLYLDGFPRFDPGGEALWYVLRNLQRGYPPATGRESTVEIPRPPLQSVEWIKYLDPAGVEQTLDPSAYRVLHGTPGGVVPAAGRCWPATLCGPDVVTVRFVAGYGGAAAVPAHVKAAIKLFVGDLYEHRESYVVGQAPAEIPGYVRNVLAPADWGGS